LASARSPSQAGAIEHRLIVQLGDDITDAHASLLGRRTGLDARHQCATLLLSQVIRVFLVMIGSSMPVGGGCQRHQACCNCHS
jgi:hypothetical protein